MMGKLKSLITIRLHSFWSTPIIKYKVPKKSLLFILILFILILAVLFFLFHPGKFASSSYPFIKQKDISHHLDPSPDALKLVAQTQKPLCVTPTFDNILLYPNTSVSNEDLKLLASRLNIEDGGFWKPQNCLAQHQIAIIVPFRNRESQLNTFLAFMHSFLQQQLLEYRIIVVEQVPKGAFNRAKLFNIGFAEALKLNPIHCFIFHDVDLLPQKLSNMYACTHNPRHMSSSVNTHRYNLPYKSLFGGAIAITKDQFEMVNGFSNVFYGWGGEDDDFHNRIASKGLHICRFEPIVSRYFMLAHKKEVPSENRFENLESGSNRYETDGINSLKYVIVDSKYEKLYTWFLVDL